MVWIGESGKNLLHLDFADPLLRRNDCSTVLVKESFYLADQNMVRQYVDDGPIVMKDYLGWAERAGQDFFCCPPANWIASGLSFTKALVQGLKETAGIQTFEDMMIVEVLTNEKTVCGAVGIDIYTGEAVLFRTKAVVIGTGGYMPFSMNNTVTDMTGDGPAMAYRAHGDLVPTKQPMGNLYEQSAVILFDCMSRMLKQQMNVSDEEMEKRHRNYE